MKTPDKRFWIFALVIVLVVGGFFLFTSQQDHAPRLLETSTIDDFRGRPSLVVFAETNCPDCQMVVSDVEEQIWKSNKSDANIWINTLDQQKFEQQKLPQGFNPNLSFEEICNCDPAEECEGLPSWVILDENFQPVTFSCGGDAEKLGEMKRELERLLEEQDQRGLWKF